ncbi:MAG: winged helix-turn-helix transcriptional regulator [Phycisphaerales bacterium]|nr:winged helix-turn-helix transcriptional regulator [Phycisphaerales bacterium]
MMTQSRKRGAISPKQAARRRAPLDAMLDAGRFKALGDPTRVRLLACLAKCGRACGVTEIAECCAVDLSVVSRHLSLLRRAGLLEVEKQGRIVLYSVRYGDWAEALRALADAIEACCPAGARCGGGRCGC